MGSPLYDVNFTDNGIAILKMNNGENRFNISTIDQLNNALDKVLSNTECRALITTGTGKFYSNGIDLNWLANQDQPTTAAFFEKLYDILWRLMHFPIPTIAAINGHAFAGGAFMAMSHDYRIIREDRGWICWNEIHLKMLFGTPLLHLLSKKVRDLVTVREAIIFGKRITGPQAMEMQLVDKIVPDQQVLEESKELAMRVLGAEGFDRETLQKMKMDIYPRSSGGGAKL